MLKITINETSAERRWVLQGKLIGAWVREFRLTWKSHRTQPGQRCVVDLNDVTFIDRSGERLLRAISRTGVQLVATGVYTKHLLESVQTASRPRQVHVRDGGAV